MIKEKNMDYFKNTASFITQKRKHARANPRFTLSRDEKVAFLPIQVMDFEVRDNIKYNTDKPSIYNREEFWDQIKGKRKNWVD